MNWFNELLDTRTATEAAVKALELEAIGKSVCGVAIQSKVMIEVSSTVK